MSSVQRRLLAAFADRERLAIADVRRQISYGELRSAVHGVIEHFHAHLDLSSPERQPRIAILCRNSIEHLVLTYAAYLAGVTWTPLNVQLPEAMLAQVIGSLEPDILFHAPEFGEFAAKHRDLAVHVEDISTPGLFDYARKVDDRTFEHAVSRRKGPLAYIIFTSGSSGAHKGVMISYGALDNYLEQSAEPLKFNADTRNLSITPYYFDAPLGTIFLTPMYRGQLHVYPGLTHPGLIARVLVEKQITYIGTTPGLLKKIIEALAASDTPAALKVVGVGGDDLIKKDVEEILRLQPGLTLLNRYGPTETTSVASSFTADPERLSEVEKIPIGRPLGNVRFEVLGDDGDLVADGGEGELLIAGAQNMVGYWRDPELTERATWRGVDGTSFYRTGDRVRRAPDGLYFYIGRMGRMVKKNGYRVYLSEIESGLNAIDYIEQATCLEDNRTPGRVLCVLAARKPLSRRQIAQDLRTHLADYMVPEEFFQCDGLQLTDVGKFDGRTLEHMLAHEQLQRIV